MSHLRLVTDEPPDPPEPKRRRRRVQCTPEQRQRLLVVLRNLHRTYGTWGRLASAMGMSISALEDVCAGKGGSLAMAVRAAALAGTTVETIMSGAPVAADACQTCGRKVPSVATR